MRKIIVPTLLLLAIALAGCGSSTPSDQSAASCLANNLNGGSCQHPGKIFDATPSGVSAAPASEYVKATCIHQQGSQFVCQASNGGSYLVTDDGSNIAYQQQQP